MNRKVGFTLIELLTVMAIIAVLAAIAFPVYTRAKDSALRNSDMSNMNALRSALQLYRVDQGGYPPALLGYVTLYQSGPHMNEVIPANELQTYLYPKRVDTIKIFQPSHNRYSMADITPATWPLQDPRAVGTAPLMDFDGDGVKDDPSWARQAYGPSDGYVANGTRTVTNDVNVADKFYKISGYDVAEIPIDGGGPRFELRYALFWTIAGLGNGDGLDDPRQLGYDDPPESTVVTWNGDYREYVNGAPERQKRDIVLFLGGNARSYDCLDLHQRSWRVMP
jgi:prepilin-type N-terminal cleavage/methylation domain-containing protein